MKKFCFRMPKLLIVLIICKEKIRKLSPFLIVSGHIYKIVKLWHKYTMFFFEENSSEELEFKTSYKDFRYCHNKFQQ